METQQNNEQGRVGIITADTTREDFNRWHEEGITEFRIACTPEEWSQVLIRLNGPMVTLNVGGAIFHGL